MTLSRRTNLLKDSFLFFLFGCIVWSVNSVGQNIFPGTNVFPFLVRTVISLGIVMACYYVNLKLLKKNNLNVGLLKFDFKSKSIQQSLKSIILGCVLMLLIFTIFYLVYPFQIIKNQNYTSNFFADVISYSLGNSLEELLFRCFLLLAIVKQIGKIYGTLIVSLLFGVFHLQGLGLTPAGLSMVVTTFTMSLLLVSIIYFTNSIWPAIAFHITINLLLHTFLGFDNKNNGILHLEFISSDGIQNFATLVYEVVVCAFAILIYLRAGKKK